MTQDVTRIREQVAIQVVDVEPMTASWPDLLKRPIRDETERLEIARSVEALCVPASRDWVLGRVAALLSQYYAADLPKSIVKVMAEDWAESLRGYPEWAITKAVRWWKSDANTERKRKPLEGDIVARVRFEMGIVKVAEGALERFDNDIKPYVPPQDEHRRQPTEQERINAAKLLQDAGYAPKRMGGAA